MRIRSMNATMIMIPAITLTWTMERGVKDWEPATVDRFPSLRF